MSNPIQLQKKREASGKSAVGRERAVLASEIYNVHCGERIAEAPKRKKASSFRRRRKGGEVSRASLLRRKIP